MVLPSPLQPPVRQLNRNIVIGASVLVFHVAALWALQSGLLRRAVEIVVPVAVLSEIMAPPAPKVEQQPPEPAKPVPPAPAKEPVARKVERARPPAPRPVAVADPAPASEAPSGVEVPMPPAPAPAPALSAAVEPAPAPARLELPSTDADYLRNPAPVYPPMSKRLGEQGVVVMRVLIGPDGIPQKAELKRSSGFDRLDRAAREHVMKCRYVPGKVAGVAQAMWYDAPVNYVLE